ncbi:unnamed protein product, partial [Clonostachys rhizophaga]
LQLDCSIAPIVLLPPDSDLEYSDLGPEYSDKSNINSIFNNNNYKYSEYRSNITIFKEFSDKDKKVFQLYIKRATGDKINLKLNQKIYRALRDLAKKYRLSNKNKTFIVPKNFFNPLLFLSPYIYLLGILFYYQVFKALSLTSPDKLDILNIYTGEKELLLPLKKEFNNYLVFCYTIKILIEYTISIDIPIIYRIIIIPTLSRFRDTTSAEKSIRIYRLFSEIKGYSRY